MQTILSNFANEISTFTFKCYHYTAPLTTSTPYLVWAEDERVDLIAGNSHSEKAVQGTIDYFTKTEFDSNVDTIESKLESLGISWFLNSVQYEEETGLIHYEWVFTIE